jgi:molybdopterin synthase sulfur carrier subunit
MGVTVRIPTPLRKFTGGKADVVVEGSTLREVLQSLDAGYAGFQAKVCDDAGEIRRFINVFVNGEDVRHKGGLAAQLKAGDEISIVPAIAGGASGPALR